MKAFDKVLVFAVMVIGVTLIALSTAQAYPGPFWWIYPR